MDYNIIPSTCVGNYFVHKCERFLMRQGLECEESVKEASFQTVSYAENENALIKAEKTFKENIVDKLAKKGSVTYKPGVSHEKYGYFSSIDTLEEIKKSVNEICSNNIKRNHYIFQGTLEVTERFKEEYLKRGYIKATPALCDVTDPYLKVDFSQIMPDLIRISWDGTNSGVILSIVDIKFSFGSKLEHKITVNLYTEILRAWIDEYNLNNKTDKIDVVIENKGYVFNCKEKVEEAFLLSETDYLLKNYFSTVFPNMIEKLHSTLQSQKNVNTEECFDVFVGKHCNSCCFYQDCMRNLKERGDYALIPYLTEYAQKYAEDLCMPRNLKDFIAEISNKKEELHSNYSWNALLYKPELLEQHQSACPYTEESIKAMGYMWTKEPALHMPQNSNCTLILTAQKNEVKGKVCVLGGYVQYPNNKYATLVKVVNDQEADTLKAMALDFINIIYNQFYGLQKVDFKSGIFLQVYVMDHYERDNFEELLYELLQSNITDEQEKQIKCIMRWLGGTSVVTVDHVQPEYFVENPLVVITEEIQKMLYLPVPVAYNLRNIQLAFDAQLSETDKQLNENDDPYFGQLSDELPTEVIYSIWDAKAEKTEYENALKTHMEKRLYTIAAILFKLQKEANKEKLLVRRLKKFEIPKEYTEIENTFLRRLFYESRYEDFVDYSKYRTKRTTRPEIAFRRGDLLKIKVVECQGTTLKAKILEGDSSKAKDWGIAGLAMKIQDVYELNDLEDRVWNTESESKVLYIKSIRWGNWLFGARRYNLEGTIERGSEDIQRGDEVFLFELASNCNTEKTLKKALKNIEENKRLDILNPKELSREMDDGYRIKDYGQLIQYSQMGDQKFTESQEEAFLHFASNYVTVLQGPPGTGKTDFIARSLVAMCRYFKEKEGKALRVLVSANSHAAIENVLCAIGKKVGKNSDIKLYRVQDSGKGGSKKHGVECITRADLSRKWDECEENREPIIVGATQWSAGEMSDGQVFDVVVIDEASQVKVMDALIVLSRGTSVDSIDTEQSKKNTARILLVGDDEQLAPILKGKYLDGKNKPYEYGSVFRFYREYAKKENLNYCKMLEENFRMNDILSRYSAEQIYTPQYRAENSEIANGSLMYDTSEISPFMNGLSKEVSELVKFVLDDFDTQTKVYWPLIFCEISGGNTREQQDKECELVTALTGAIYKLLKLKMGGRSFWKDVFGIIAPHHSHIDRLKKDINNNPDIIKEDLCIDTVDKFQGQQRDAVIVSYGVSDIERIAVQKEFIYSRNRLNVSLTRARFKNIVFLSKALMNPPLEVLSSKDEDLQKGVKFVTGFLAFMENAEADSEVSKREFAFGNVKVTVYRKRIKQ